ncbi:DNA repair protein endonuclease SAE2/CtIP C-terminus-domain-containing protein [Geopyxis carbonaria]|nr:DNA repair protein endonuclease SAE2/CtIP C-terminus-domain-containing protein [Geopyxis carbonaria]
MEQLRTTDRNAFNDLIYQHFKRLEIETEKWDEERVSLNLAIGKRDERIAQLEKDLREARQSGSHLEKAESARQRRMLQAANDRSLANKENVPDSEKPIPTLQKAITRPVDTQILPQESVNRAPELENSEDLRLASLTEELNKLRNNYQGLEKERDHYKNEFGKTLNAHNLLIEKYTQNKNIWKDWTRHDEKLRASAKRKLQGGSQGRPEMANSRLHTPESPRPPIISPIKSVIEKSRAMRGLAPEGSTIEPIKKGGLFSHLKPPVSLEHNNFSGTLSKDIPEWDPITMKKAITPPEVDSIPSDPPSSIDFEIPATQEQPQTPAFDRFSRPSSALSDHGDDEFTLTSDAESGHREGSATPKAKPRASPEPMLPPPVPPIHRETSRNSQTQGLTRDKPVVIKSEPQSEGPGYHIFEEESLDLDDVGDVPEPPKKKIKHTPNTNQPVPNYTENFKHLGHVNDEEIDVPVLLSPRVHNGMPSGIRTDSQLQGLQTPYKNIKPLPAKTSIARANSPATVRPISPSPQRTRRKTPQARTPLNQPTKRKSRDCRNATVSVLEDGTDGEVDVNRNNEVPDIVTKTRLDDILSTPMPKSPSLKMIGKETNTRSVPARRTGWGGGSPDPPSNNTRHAHTDPRPHGSTATDVPRRQSNKQDTPTAQSRPRRLGNNSDKHNRRPADVRDFRVNPKLNQGYDYAFQETVRRKEERKCLPGCTKACCRDMGKFVEAAGLPVMPKGPRWRSSSPAPPVQSSQDIRDEQARAQEEHREFVQKYGRHRDAFPRRNTPPGFWESDFPDTQQLKKQHGEAEEMQRKRAEEMRREAEKGARGRFTYR